MELDNIEAKTEGREPALERIRDQQRKHPAQWTEKGSAAYLRISLALFLAGFATFSLLYNVQPIFPQLAKQFGIGATQSSLALSLSTGFLAFSIMCAGAVSERVGRRGLMFVSITLAAVLNIIAALGSQWTFLLLCRALEGLALGGVPAVAMAYLAEEISPAGLGLSMGLYVGGTAFGGMIGRVGMSILAEHFSWRTALCGIGVIDLVVAIAFLMLLPKSKNFIGRADVTWRQHFALWRAHLRTPGLPYLFVVGCLAMGVFVTVYNYATFRLMAPPFNLTPTQTGLIFSAYIVGIIASSMAGALADQVGRGPVLMSGIVIAGAGVALTCRSDLVSVVAGIVALTAGFFIAHSVASGWVGQMANGAKGHASSLYLLAYYAGSSVLGSAGGWFWERGAWGAVAGYSFALLALAIVAAVLARRGGIPRRTA